MPAAGQALTPCVWIQRGAKPSTLHAGYTPAASVIAPQDLTICKKKDGSDFLLGQGTFGAVRPPRHECQYHPGWYHP